MYNEIQSPQSPEFSFPARNRQGQGVKMGTELPEIVLVSPHRRLREQSEEECFEKGIKLLDQYVKERKKSLRPQIIEEYMRRLKEKK